MTQAIAVGGRLGQALYRSEHFRVLPLGLRVDGKPTAEQWDKFGDVLRALHVASIWATADWLLYGDGRGDYGETYDAAIARLGLSYGRMANLLWLARKFEFSRRHENLSAEHHALVGGLETTKEQDRWLDKAEREQWDYAELRAALRAARHAARTIDRDWPEGKYGVILADPPWRPDEGLLDPTREIENQYPTLTLGELIALDEHVKGIAATDCVLLLWTTTQKIAEAVEVVDAWGFTVKSGAVWVKDTSGMGYWFRGRHELLVLATVGHPATPLEGDRPDSVIVAPRRGHSQKPDEQYALVERMFPGVPKIELFARECKARPVTWATWGNEAIAVRGAA